MKKEKNLQESTEQSLTIPVVIDSIISDLESRVYNLSTNYNKMKVGDFKNLPEVKELMITISVLEKYYR